MHGPPPPLITTAGGVAVNLRSRPKTDAGRFVGIARAGVHPTAFAEHTERLRQGNVVVDVLDVVAVVEHAQEFFEEGQFVDVSGAGHMVAGDRNDRFCDAVVEFLEALPTT